MKRTKKRYAPLAVWIMLVSCYAPTQIYPEEMSTPIYATVPALVQRGKYYTFFFKTNPNATCHAGINFWDTSNNWLHEELPIIKADDRGVCQWVWKIPENAKNGTAGFRGYVEIESQNENTFPSTFCIEKCP